VSSGLVACPEKAELRPGLMLDLLSLLVAPFMRGVELLDESR